MPLPPLTGRNQGQTFDKAVRARMDGLRNAGGENLDFVLDGAARLTPGDASSVAASLERFHLLWFDELCPVANLQTVRKIAEENVTPLGFGSTVKKQALFRTRWDTDVWTFSVLTSGRMASPESGKPQLLPRPTT